MNKNISSKYRTRQAAKAAACLMTAGLPMLEAVAVASTVFGVQSFDVLDGCLTIARMS